MKIMCYRLCFLVMNLENTNKKDDKYMTKSQQVT